MKGEAGLRCALVLIPASVLQSSVSEGSGLLAHATGSENWPGERQRSHWREDAFDRATRGDHLLKKNRKSVGESGSRFRTELRAAGTGWPGPRHRPFGSRKPKRLHASQGDPHATFPEQPAAEVSQGGKAAVESDLYFDALSVDSEKGADETLGCEVSVLSPDYCSDVKGDTKVTLSAPGFQRVTAKCWKPGRGFGSDSTVATVELDARGKGSFVFRADEYPHGPVTLRISGANGGVKDTCYLQLYNKGGVSWNEGMPKDPPPAAKGLKLVFADDFKGPLSISSTDPKATYYDHKPPGGTQDFSRHVFSGHDAPKNPFSQVDTYLRIRASDKKKSSGLISSLKAERR